MVTVEEFISDRSIMFLPDMIYHFEDAIVGRGQLQLPSNFGRADHRCPISGPRAEGNQPGGRPPVRQFLRTNAIPRPGPER